MLLAGRNGKGERWTKEYTKHKLNNSHGKKVAKDRGARHIANVGLAHPKYSAESENFVRDYYKNKNWIIGEQLTDDQVGKMQDALRKWHKQFDKGKNGPIDEEVKKNKIL